MSEEKIKNNKKLGITFITIGGVVLVAGITLAILFSCQPKQNQTYTVTWKNWDDTVLEVDEEVKKGEMPTYDGDMPVKPDDERNVYTFKNWSPSVQKVTKDVTYKAQFSSAQPEYHVRFFNGDDVVVEYDTARGNTVQWYQDIPWISGNEEYCYKFTGWDKPFEPLTGPTDYHATYEPVPTESLFTVTELPGDYCSIKLNRYDIGGVFVPASLNGLKVTELAEGFAYGTNNQIKEIILPNGLTTIGQYAFNGCYLDSLVIPDSVSSFDYYAFFFAFVNSITIGANMNNVTTTTFINTYALSNISVSPDNPHYSSYDGCLYTKDLSTLLIVPKSKSGTLTMPDAATTIEECTFINTNFTKFVLGKNVEDFKYPYNFFVSASCLNEFEIHPDNQYYSIDGGILYSKDYKTLYVAPNFVSGVVNIKEGCEIITDYAFRNVDKATEFNIPEGVTTIGELPFSEHCIGVTTIRLPSTLVNYPADPTRFLNDCFWNLESIEVAEGNPVFCSISGSLYSKDQKTLLFVPSGCTTESYHVPSTVEVVETRAFYACHNITSIHIPLSVTLLKFDSLSAYSLTDVYYPGTKAQFRAILEEGFTSQTITVHCSDGDIATNGALW